MHSSNSSDFSTVKVLRYTVLPKVHNIQESTILQYGLSKMNALSIFSYFSELMLMIEVTIKSFQHLMGIKDCHISNFGTK